MKNIEKKEIDDLVGKVSKVIETHFSKGDKFVFEVNPENYQKFKHLRPLSFPDGFIANLSSGNLSWGFWYSHIPEEFKLITFEEFAHRFIKEPLRLPDIVKYVIKDDEKCYKLASLILYGNVYGSKKLKEGYIVGKDDDRIRLFKNFEVLDILFNCVRCVKDESNLNYDFKDGDIVKVLNTKNVCLYNSKAVNTLFRISLPDCALKEWENGRNYSVDPTNFHNVNYYREDLIKATDEEIEHFNKLSEAVKKYPIGTVYYPIRPTNKKQGYACESNGKFCVTACGNIINTDDTHVYDKTINKWAEFKLIPPEIFINGHKGEFFPDYVKFGCAQIDRDLFDELVINGCLDTRKNSNRSIESITIGNGIFSKSQIEQIVDYYDKYDDYDDL